MARIRAAPKDERSQPPTPDRGGGRRVSTYDTLANMRRRGGIGDDHLTAGRRFEADYEAAFRGALRATDPTRTPGRGARPGSDGTDQNTLDARDRLWRALEALGGADSPTGLAARLVLGEGETLSSFGGRGLDGCRPLGAERAAGIVTAALALLARHYARGPAGRR